MLTKQKTTMVSFHTPLSPNHHHHHHHSKAVPELLNNPSKKRKWDEAELPQHVDRDHMIKPWMNSSSIDFHLDIPLPSDWQRCLDIQSGEIHFYNTRTHKRAQRDPRLSDMAPPQSQTRKPSSFLNLDLELNLAHGDHQDIPATKVDKKNYISDDNKTISTLSLFSSSSVPAADPDQQEMVAAACKRCHLLVMLCKSCPTCPNCKFMHPTAQSSTSLLKPRPSLLC